MFKKLRAFFAPRPPHKLMQYLLDYSLFDSVSLRGWLPCSNPDSRLIGVLTSIVNVEPLDVRVVIRVFEKAPSQNQMFRTYWFRWNLQKRTEKPGHGKLLFGVCHETPVPFVFTDGATDLAVGEGHNTLATNLLMLYASIESAMAVYAAQKSTQGMGTLVTSSDKEQHDHETPK